MASTSSASSIDEDELNGRVKPDWAHHRKALERRGFRLETARDVRRYYEGILSEGRELNVCERKAYSQARQADDNALSGDAGLVRFNAMFMPVSERH